MTPVIEYKMIIATAVLGDGPNGFDCCPLLLLPDPELEVLVVASLLRIVPYVGRPMLPPSRSWSTCNICIDIFWLLNV